MNVCSLKFVRTFQSVSVGVSAACLEDFQVKFLKDLRGFPNSDSQRMVENDIVTSFATFSQASYLAFGG